MWVKPLRRDQLLVSKWCSRFVSMSCWSGQNPSGHSWPLSPSPSEMMWYSSSPVNPYLHHWRGWKIPLKQRLPVLQLRPLSAGVPHVSTWCSDKTAEGSFLIHLQSHWVTMVAFYQAENSLSAPRHAEALLPPLPLPHTADCWCSASPGFGPGKRIRSRESCLHAHDPSPCLGWTILI